MSVLTESFSQEEVKAVAAGCLTDPVQVTVAQRPRRAKEPKAKASAQVNQAVVLCVSAGTDLLSNSSQNLFFPC